MFEVWSFQKIDLALLNYARSFIFSAFCPRRHKRFLLNIFWHKPENKSIQEIPWNLCFLSESNYEIFANAEVNDFLDTLLSLDQMLRDGNCSIDMSLKLWKVYLVILKSQHKSFSFNITSKLSSALRKYVLEILESLNFSSNEIQMQNKLNILFFSVNACQQR